MVPDYSSCANSKSEENLKSADILTEDWQFLNKLACLNRIHHHPLNASQKHQLPAITRLYGRQWQHYLGFKANACRLFHPARAAIPRRFVSANTRNIVALTQVNLIFLRRLKSLAPLQVSGARSQKVPRMAESPPDATPVNTLITVHLS